MASKLFNCALYAPQLYAPVLFRGTPSGPPSIPLSIGAVVQGRYDQITLVQGGYDSIGAVVQGIYSMGINTQNIPWRRNSKAYFRVKVQGTDDLSQYIPELTVRLPNNGDVLFTKTLPVVDTVNRTIDFLILSSDTSGIAQNVIEFSCWNIAASVADGYIADGTWLLSGGNRQ